MTFVFSNETTYFLSERLIHRSIILYVDISRLFACEEIINECAPFQSVSHFSDRSTIIRYGDTCSFEEKYLVLFKLEISEARSKPNLDEICD